MKNRPSLSLTIALLLCFVIVQSSTYKAIAQNNDSAISSNTSIIASITGTMNGLWNSIVTWLIEDSPCEAGSATHHIPTADALNTNEQ